MAVHACDPRTFSSTLSSRSATFAARPPFPLLPLPFLATECVLLDPGLVAHAVGVAVARGTGVRVALGGLGRQLAEHDDAGRAAVDAERTASADVFVDDERDVVARVFTRL